MKAPRIYSIVLSGCILILAGAVMTGCKKDDNTAVPEQDAALQTTYDQAVATAAFDDAGNVADEGITAVVPDGRLTIDDRWLTSCATFDFDLFSSPRRLTIDFGETDCLGRDGNYRRGKIMVTWTAPYREPGAVITLAFDNYYLNFNKIEGSKTTTNLGRNDMRHLAFDVSVQGKVFIDAQYSPDGVPGTVTYTAHNIRNWVEGENTFRVDDDIYLISGTSGGVSSDGSSFQTATADDNPVKKEVGFPHFTNGVVNITRTPPDSDVSALITIDYGYYKGQRDDLAQVTISGKTYTIHLGLNPHI